MKTIDIAKLTPAQRRLRYSITIDIEYPLSEGESLKSAIEWFNSKECAEIYGIENGIYPETGERMIGVVFEVVNHFNFDNLSNKLN